MTTPAEVAAALEHLAADAQHQPVPALPTLELRSGP